MELPGHCCGAPESVGTGVAPSRGKSGLPPAGGTRGSQGFPLLEGHGEVRASPCWRDTGKSGLPGPEGLTKSMLTPNYASSFLFGRIPPRKSQIHDELPVSIIILDDAANHKQCEIKKQPAQKRH
jgi:hypothetical protein